MSNRKIELIFKSDQNNRRNQKDLVKKDMKRLEQLERILAGNLELNGQDYYMIAMVYHHGPTVEHIKTARMYAGKGMRLGDKQARWLYAAATDRILLLQGKPQRYGTQWQIKNGKCILWPVNLNTTDRARARYGIEPLKVIRAGIRKKNERV